MYRTDMAVEIFKPDRKNGVHLNIIGGEKGIKRTDIIVDSIDAHKLKRPQGKYITVEVADIGRHDPVVMQRAGIELSLALTNLIGRNIKEAKPKNTLVVGLGNRGMTADALGHKIVEKIIVTRHFSGQDGKKSERKLASVCAFCPNVLGVTGIESFDVVSGIVERVKPDLIIVADTLASRCTERLSSAFQVSDTGIVPGSGVGNNRFELSNKTLGVPVISVGVPLVVYASTIVNDVLEEAKNKYNNQYEDIGKGLISEVVGDLVVTPKDIDVIVKDCAFIIALAVNLAIHRRLKIDDVLEMMA